MTFAPTGAAAATTTFGFTGGEQSYVVPAGITQLQVVAVGAPGGKGFDDTPGIGGAGGFGSLVTGTLAVTAGEKLFIEVGGGGKPGAGGGTGGFNGGGDGGGGDCAGLGSCPAGGGGGATDIRACSVTSPACPTLAASLGSRILIAAGGGGGGTGNGLPATGGAGGAGASDGNQGQPTTGGCTGGEGGTAGTASGGGGGGGLYGGGGGGGGNGTAAGGGGGGSNLIDALQSVSVRVDSTGKPMLAITPVVAVVPLNKLSFGTLKRNKKRGTARLVVTTSGAGTVILKGNGIQTQAFTESGNSFTLPVIPLEKLKRKLHHKHKARIAITVTFIPANGSTRITQSESAKLIRKR